MAMKRIRRISQTADLAATIHGVFEAGGNESSAVAKAMARYPNLKGSDIAAIATRIYTARSTLDDYFGGNMGQITNPGKAFGCSGNSIRFTTYTTFIDTHTGLPKEYWVDTVVTFESKNVRRGDLVWFLFNEGINRARQLGYDPKPLLPGATAASLIQSGVLKITGFQCI